MCDDEYYGGYGDDIVSGIEDELKNLKAEYPRCANVIDKILSKIIDISLDNIY